MKQEYLKKYVSIISLLSLIVLIFSIDSYAQNGNTMTVKDRESFIKILSGRAASVNTLSAEFRQTKNMEMLKNDMISEGKFFYEKSNKIAFMYERPGKYSMVMNGSFIRMSTKSGSSVMDLSANPVMKQMNDLISAVFTGALDNMSVNYNVDFELNGDKIFALVKPKSTRISAIVSQIKIAFNKHSGDINEIVITEGSGSSTKYIFYNQIINQPIRNEIFTIN